MNLNHLQHISERLVENENIILCFRNTIQHARAWENHKLDDTLVRKKIYMQFLVSNDIDD